MENKIEIHNMNLHYGDFHALHDINLDIKENEITAFIGPSGCGKSTLLRSLNRMNDLVENCRITGDIMLDGRDIYKNCDVNLLRRRVGMVFQKPNPFPMSIYDNIAYGPRTHGIKSRVQLDEIVETSLKRAAIWEETKDNLKKSALSMSGGQQQRICIARALAADPEVLLMDEPTSALDPISTAKIEDLVLELKKDYTIVMVTHNMQQATRVSDTTAFFLLGDIRLAAAAIRIDQEIDRKEREIESMCLKLLLQQQPVASDLRLISSVLKMITDIERIGDQASDIAEIVTYLSGACGHNTHIDQMAQATIKMVTDSLDAFVRRDLTLAWSVIEYDDVVDRLFDECKSDLIAEIAQNPEDGERVLDVLMIAKYLERIGDHATNIAEWVEFSITGSHKSAMHGAEAAAR